jgi:hypothetical protein
MRAISVEIIDRAPAGFEVSVEQAGGSRYRLPREHPEVVEIEELAYGRLLQGAVRPLPAGAIRVRVAEDRHGNRPTSHEIAAYVARVVRDRDGGWQAWA